MRDYLEIVRRNLTSPIVIGIFLLAAALLFVGERRDAWFVSVVIIINSLIAILQEIRAKRALKKLELMSAPKARLWQGEKLVEIDFSELVAGNEVEILAGDEIPADIKIKKSHGLEVDESMLTGESAAVTKDDASAVLASTVAVAGSARGVVVATGANTKAGMIGQKLRRYRPELTPLQKVIQQIITFQAFGAIALAIVIFVVYYFIFADVDMVKILKTITSAAVTVVPEGLLLASSLLLAFGSLKLAQVKVLPQKLSAIEAMALLNILCTDKTGTLTSDKIVFDRLEVFSGTRKNLADAAAIIAQEASSGNATGKAISSALEVPKKTEITEVMAFSSERKMSAVRLVNGNKTRTLFMGAAEYISGLVALTEEQRREVDKWSGEGQRVLLVAEVIDNKTALTKMSSAKGTVLGAVILTNPLRSGVENTIKFLQNQGVKVKVISGDNPRTVEYVARLAGVNDAHKVITGAALASLKDKQFKQAADEHTIFSRVLPEQKERLIAHFQSTGLFTGMVGDGVNDALALKQADLGVAMYSGAVVSRRVSDIILLNNSFNALPIGMRLGNKIMQAIEVIATLFFHKIIFGVILLLVTMAVGLTYPFEPRHITFMNMFLVTMPTIMWTVFPPEPKHRVNPSRFWRDTLWAVLPVGVITGLAISFTYWAMQLVYPNQPISVATMTVLTATFFGVYMVYLVPQMLGVRVNKRARQARLIYIAAVIFVALTSFSFGFLRDFFDFSLPTIWILWPAMGVIMLAGVLQWHIAKTVGNRFVENIDNN